jgi:sugar-phosphatase
MTLFDGITHIIFDLDGLLIDSEPVWGIAEDQVLQRYGKRWDAEIARRHIGLRVDEATGIMIREYGLKTDAHHLATEIYDTMMELLAEATVIMPGADKTIQLMHQRGYTLGIASSSAQSYIESVVDRLGWGGYLAVLASGDSVPRGKPAPDVYLLAAERLGVYPQHCLALEDSLNGAKAAQSAGMRTVVIPGHEFTPPQFQGVADVIYPSLLEFLKAIPY